jgi:membrane dipeptidase
MTDARELLAVSDAWDLTTPFMPQLWDFGVLQRFRAAGFTFVSLTMQDWPPTWDGTIASIERFEQLAEAQSDWLIVGSSKADLERGRAEGKLVVGYNAQETRVLEHELGRVERLRAAGVRQMLLAYNVRNLVADGCAEPADAGLSTWGRKVVKEMNRVGIVVDCSHTGRRSSLEAIELSERPPIFSHSGAHAVHAHIRNITDEQLRACAERGGAIGIVGVGAFIGDLRASTETMFRHVDHAVSLVGPEHVGIALDFVPNMPRPPGEPVVEDGQEWPLHALAWPDPAVHRELHETHYFEPEQLVELVQSMLDHGYAVDAVRGILGGNFKRVYEEFE